MENKTVKISELLDDYTDNEFCIEGETEVQNEEIKDIVLKKAKKRGKPAKRIIIAAVAATAALAAIMGAAAQRIAFTAFDNTELGYIVDEDGHEGKYIAGYFSEENQVVTEENNRLYFIYGGEKTDITDLVDEETPYIYKCHDQPTDVDNAENYIIVGGTPDAYGYTGFILFDGDWALSGILSESHPDWEINGIKQLKSEGRLVGLDIEQMIDF